MEPGTIWGTMIVGSRHLLEGEQRPVWLKEAYGGTIQVEGKELRQGGRQLLCVCVTTDSVTSNTPTSIRWGKHHCPHFTNDFLNPGQQVQGPMPQASSKEWALQVTLR